MASNRHKSLEHHKANFWSQVTRADNGCWNWSRATKRNPYGVYSYNGKCVRCNRFSYFIANGFIDDNLMVLHKCDNRACVNPDHLYQGDAKQNMKDRTDRGRVPDRHKTKHPMCKLNQKKAKEIKALCKKGVLHTEIAKIYGISRQHVSHVNKDKGCWKND